MSKADLRKFLISFIFLFSFLIPLTAEVTPYTPENSSTLPPKLPPENLRILKKAYPDLLFIATYDKELQDFKITITAPNYPAKDFYWCNGSLLPKEELINKDKYWTLIYPYNNELKDPATMTEEEKEKLIEFTSKENRRNGLGTPMFFFDYLYNSYNQKSVEKEILQTTFLGHKTRIHQRISEPLSNVEKKIQEEAKYDKEIADFVSKIKSSDAFHWREIDGTNRKSFHSLGIAIDILPVRITGEIFWSWARDKNPNGWMLTPLSRRWMPPKKVIDIFESEGFIWGGNWVIWDNMHFEYHPELIIKG